jgi:hypothetical protein
MPGRCSGGVDKKRNSAIQQKNRGIRRCAGRAGSVGHCPEDEFGDCDTEIFPAFPPDQIRAFHATLERLKDAVAVVFMEHAGGNDGLFTDDSFAFDLFDAGAAVIDEPVAAENLDILIAVVLDADKVAEHEFLEKNIRLAVHIERVDCDGNVLRRGSVW